MLWQNTRARGAVKFRPGGYNPGPAWELHSQIIHSQIIYERAAANGMAPVRPSLLTRACQGRRACRHACWAEDSAQLALAARVQAGIQMAWDLDMRRGSSATILTPTSMPSVT